MKLEQLREAARTDILAYMSLLRPGTMFGKHHYLLRDITQDLLAGKLQNVVVSIAPRHGKSFFLSEVLPAYWLGHRAKDQIIAASYGSSLAAKFGGSVRTNLSSEAHAFVFGSDSQPTGRSKSGAQFWTQAGGIYKSCGVGAAITGYGADLLLCDDLVKSAATADSPTFRDGLEQYFGETLYTRRMPGGRILAIGTRWRSDDILAYLEGNFPDWTFINLPALADSEDDIFGRQPGEALWPEFWSAEALSTIRETIGESAFSALYQGQPVSATGGTIRVADVRLLDAAPTAATHGTMVDSYCVWDTAVSAKTTADFSVGQYWQTWRQLVLNESEQLVNRFVSVLVDYVRLRADFDDLAAAIEALAAKHGVRTVVLEHGHSGLNLQSHLSGRSPGLSKHCVELAVELAVELIVPRNYGDKMERMQATLPQWRAGDVQIVRSQATDFDDCIEELVKAGKTRHDDFLDATIYGLLYELELRPTRQSVDAPTTIYRAGRQHAKAVGFAGLPDGKAGFSQVSFSRPNKLYGGASVGN